MRPSRKRPAHPVVTVLNAMVREPVLSITAGVAFIGVMLIAIGVRATGAPAADLGGGPTAAAVGDVPTSPAADTIHAVLRQWRISLSRPTVTTGPVVLHVTNEGTMPHRLEVEGHGLEKRTAAIAPGERADLSVTLGKGTYKIYCPMGSGDHQQRGMHTTLVAEAWSGATGQ